MTRIKGLIFRLLSSKQKILLRLLGGFLIIIFLLLSFHFISLSVFNRIIHEEIIKYNKQDLHHSVDRYENHIQIVQNEMIRLYFDGRVQSVTDWIGTNQFDPVNHVVDEIKALVANEQLFLDNVMIQFDHQSYLIDKSGVSETEQFAAKNYVSSDYGFDFWIRQLSQNYRLKVFKESNFKNNYYNTSISVIPVVFKNRIQEQFYIAAMLDSKKMLQAFNNSVSNSFYMFDEGGNVLFRSAPDQDVEPKLIKTGETEGFVHQDHHYVFFKKGLITGITYVYVIPYQKIADEVHRLNFVLVALLILAVTIGVVVSIIISLRFHNPIQQIISHSEAVSRDLKYKTSQLERFVYINKIKSIYTSQEEMPATNKRFYLIVFHLTMTRQFHQIIAEEKERATNCMKEFIALSLSERFPDTITMQMEKNQILSLVFMEKETPYLLQTLEAVKQVFDRDKDLCRLTIAMEPVLHNPDEFASAYEDTLEMVEQRGMYEDSRILTVKRGTPVEGGFSPEQRQEFFGHLQVGNVSDAMAAVSRTLSQMKKREAGAAQYYDFAKEVVTTVLHAMASVQAEIESLFESDPPYGQIEKCSSINEFVEFFEKLLAQAADNIKSVRNGQDPIKDFLLDYVTAHHTEDISLVVVADKLNLSPGHISKVFKQKTGKNFSEYLNDLRVNSAKELLLNTDLKVQDISDKIGYLNVNSFIRMFKKVTGTTPGEFRREAYINKEQIPKVF